MKTRLVVVAGAVAAAGIGLAVGVRQHHRLTVVPSVFARERAQAAPAPALNKAAYDAKMIELANLPPRRGCAPPRSLASPRLAARSKAGMALARRPADPARKQRATRRPCRKPLWPVHTVYPDAGALLPFDRVVAYYGNFYSRKMGILGQYPEAQVIAQLKAQAAAWAKADPSTPVVLGIDYIAVSAQSSPGRSGDYRLRMPADQIEKAIQMADQIHGLLFLDVQPGWSTVQAEVPRLAPYLKLPNVELALDPEFALVKGKRPGVHRGTLDAQAINFAAQFLAEIVAQNHLPPKILIVHRFTQGMVSDSRAIRPLPQVEIVMDMDGFGSPRLKRAAYDAFIQRRPVQFAGFKLFYKNDVRYGRHLMTPAEVLQLSPRPSVILYQ